MFSFMVNPHASHFCLVVVVGKAACLSEILRLYREENDKAHQKTRTWGQEKRDGEQESKEKIDVDQVTIY